MLARLGARVPACMQGAKFLYEKYIRKFLETHAAKIDPVFKRTEAVSCGLEQHAWTGCKHVHTSQHAACKAHTIWVCPAACPRLAPACLDASASCTMAHGGSCMTTEWLRATAALSTRHAA